MTTMTISLPDQIATQINSEILKKGFATRSEFFRTLLRSYFTNDVAFEVLEPRPIVEITKGMQKTGKYNKEFITSVTRGLARTSLYAR